MWIKELDPPYKPVEINSHSVLAMGSDDAAQFVLVQNSRGADWGNNGYFYMPYGLMHGLATSRQRIISG